MPDPIDVPAGRLFLGGDPQTGAKHPLFLKAADLTTHGVIVGMTGSGKTGLGIVLLEELLLAGLPVLVLDPKGDMGNLLLSFPSFAGAAFQPWVSERDARQAGMDHPAFAQQVADTWRAGLADWGITPERVERLRETVEFSLYTPGSSAGIQLNILGSLRAPDSEGDIENLRDEVEGFVSSLLSLVGIEGDPLSSREHILLANLIEHAWRSGQDLDLAQLLAQVQEPPLRRLGVIDLDSFFPKKDRRGLAMRLNGLLASPAFSTWIEGPPLDIQSMLYTPEGRPRAAVVSLAHLSDDERHFVVTLILSKVVTWMRAQPGSDELRALVYMDEVFGFVPPTKAPPSKKPILTILKQARAFGLGMVLATQNPVDVDYKALSNAGTWMVGRLQTERDKGRLIDGLMASGGTSTKGDIERLISGLGKRQFLYHSVRRNKPSVFGTRWAMSYLRGPMTRKEIGRLTAPARQRAADSLASHPAEVSQVATEEASGVSVAPETASGVSVSYLHPSADWSALPSFQRDSTTLEPALAVRVHLLFDDNRAGIRHTEEWEAIIHPITDPVSVEDAVALDFDDRDFVSEAPGQVSYVLPSVNLRSKMLYRRAGQAVKEYLYRTRSVSISRNMQLGIYSRVGESQEDFEARCATVAQEREDAEAAKVRTRFIQRNDRIQDMLARAQDRLNEVKVEQSTRKTDELLSGAGSLVSMFLGGRRGSRSIASGLRRASSKRSQTRRSSQRVASAENKVEDALVKLEGLEDDLAEALLDLDDKWEEKARAVEGVEIGLEKTDINVANVSLVWIPV